MMSVERHAWHVRVGVASDSLVNGPRWRLTELFELLGGTLLAVLRIVQLFSLLGGLSRHFDNGLGEHGFLKRRIRWSLSYTYIVNVFLSDEVLNLVKGSFVVANTL
jgi:hypothetical protein